MSTFKCKFCGGDGYHKMSCPTTKMVIYIPELKGKEAEEFIKKADENLTASKEDFSKQMKLCEQILKKSKNT